MHKSRPFNTRSQRTSPHSSINRPTSAPSDAPYTRKTQTPQRIARSPSQMSQMSHFAALLSNNVINFAPSRARRLLRRDRISHARRPPFRCVHRFVFVSPAPFGPREQVKLSAGAMAASAGSTVSTNRSTDARVALPRWPLNIEVSSRSFSGRSNERKRKRESHPGGVKAVAQRQPAPASLSNRTRPGSGAYAFAPAARNDRIRVDWPCDLVHGSAPVIFIPRVLEKWV